MDRRTALRVVFLGTADFAVPCLLALQEAGHDILAVVTQPDRPHGRGLLLAPSPVKVCALKLGLPVMQPRRVRSEKFIERMRELEPDVLALAAFGQIVPQALLDLPRLGPINVHGSLLPKYRGAAPIQRAIMNGEDETGVTTMWMDAALDTGDILQARCLPIGPDDTSGTLFPKLADLGAKLLVETVAGLADGTLQRQAQDPSQATLAPALGPEDSAIRWDETAEQIDRRIRGLSPKPGAFARIGGARIKIWRARAAEAPTSMQPQLTEGGVVLGLSKSPAGLLLSAGGGTVARIEEVQPDSGKRMAADAWARGRRLAVGDRFDLDCS